MTLLLLALVQLTVVCSLPAGEPHHQPAHSHKRPLRMSTRRQHMTSYTSTVTVSQNRPITSSTELQVTTSYSTAITSLQSVSITVLPSITGVCILPSHSALRGHILNFLPELPHWTSVERRVDERSRKWPWSYSIRELHKSTRDATSSWSYCTLSTSLCQYLPTN
jgi:hypothetical protein